jgi:threonine synthase
MALNVWMANIRSKVAVEQNPETAPFTIGGTKGIVEFVIDEEIIAMQRNLIHYEGIGVDPAFSSLIANICQLLKLGTLDPKEKTCLSVWLPLTSLWIWRR